VGNDASVALPTGAVLPQFVVKQMGEPRAGDGNSLFDELLGLPLIGVGQRERTVADTNRWAVHGLLRGLKTLGYPDLLIRFSGYPYELGRAPPIIDVFRAPWHGQGEDRALSGI